MAGSPARPRRGPSFYEFLEAGKKRLAGDTERQASSGEVKDLRREAVELKELVAHLSLENRRATNNQVVHDAAKAMLVPDPHSHCRE